MAKDNPFEEWTTWNDEKLANWLVNNQINIFFPNEFWKGGEGTDRYMLRDKKKESTTTNRDDVLQYKKRSPGARTDLCVQRTSFDT